jgi:GDP-4-dehydro-6-deoxy-D-mannose reductase
MKALITGVEGFVGRHMARHLVSQGYDVVGTTRRSRPAQDWPADLPIATHRCDVTSVADVTTLISMIVPDEIYHLAAISWVPRSWEDPEETFRTNVGGTLHVLEAMRRHCPGARLLVVGSSDVYGRASHGRPHAESDATNPTSPYAVSKLAAEHLAHAYHLRYGLAVVRVRPANHTGPGQHPPFVLPAWAQHVARAEAGLARPELPVGNLRVYRDFTDVRDVVVAYHALASRADPGECFNLARGEEVLLERAAKILVAMARVPIALKVEPALVRPEDAPRTHCDARRIHEHLGWKPHVPLEKTLKDLLGYWRERTAFEAPTAAAASGVRQEP